ncbi:bestrophin family protein [Leeia oryzae]|uniref:bestrophin family protein n=1 Tax=Leeia oryzae TaxID=356662 RepID=UPI00036808B2|nr:bestrophin family ion channel [Leeia oryzae]
MIVRPKLSWIQLLFVWHGSVISTIWPRLLLFFGIAVLAIVQDNYFLIKPIPLNIVPFSLLGVALAIFVSFRNNACYDRFWESRKLWGGILNRGRSLVRQVQTMTDAPEAAQQEMIELLMAFFYMLKHQLRKTDATTDIQRLVPAVHQARVTAARFKPSTILQIMGEWMAAQRKAGHLDGMSALALDESLSGLADSLGGCERIANTPIPFTYSVLMHRTVYIYCALLPYGLVSSIGFMTPVISVFVAYTFLALEAIAEELEDPFGMAASDLPLDFLSQLIESTLREQAGQAALEDRQPDLTYRLT